MNMNDRARGHIAQMSTQTKEQMTSKKSKRKNRQTNKETNKQTNTRMNERLGSLGRVGRDKIRLSAIHFADLRNAIVLISARAKPVISLEKTKKKRIKITMLRNFNG